MSDIIRSLRTPLRQVGRLGGEASLSSHQAQTTRPQPTVQPTHPTSTFTNRSMIMNSSTQNTGAWLTFTYVAFAMSVGMAGIGIWALDGNLWVKGYMAMATVFMLGSTFTLAKTLRDEHEAKRFTSRLDEAKTERLLMEVERGT
jgi:hypothetical protein